MIQSPEDFSFLGESPPLPPSLIADLHSKFADRIWDTAASAAVFLFEGWRRGF